MKVNRVAALAVAATAALTLNVGLAGGAQAVSNSQAVVTSWGFTLLDSHSAYSGGSISTYSGFSVNRIDCKVEKKHWLYGWQYQNGAGSGTTSSGVRYRAVRVSMPTNSTGSFRTICTGSVRGGTTQTDTKYWAR